MQSPVPPPNTDETTNGSRPLDQAIDDILESCPIAGEGVNRWLFTTSLKLHRLKIDPETIEELLAEATADCGRPMKSDEIYRAVRNSAPDALKKRPWRRKWPQRNYEQIEAIGFDGVRLSELEERSPAGLDPSENHAEKIIDSLFRATPCSVPAAL